MAFDNSRPLGPATRAIHHGYEPADHDFALTPPLHLTSTFAFPDEDGGVYLLGKFGPTLGGSEYLAAVHGLEAGAPPAVDLKLEARTIEAILQLIRAGHTSTAHDLSDGGLAVALAELALSNGRGLTISL